MCYFYGYTPEQVKNLSWSEWNALWKSINVIEAHSQILAIEVASFPTMKAEARKKTHRKYAKQAYVNTFKAGKTQSKDQLHQLKKLLGKQ